MNLTKETIKNAFDEYILFGGVPRLLLIKDENTKVNALLDIYDSIIIYRLYFKNTL